MIEPRELRIGNLLWIQTSATGLSPIKITGLDIYDHFKKFIPSLQPIPLTEEWLVKFGFERIENPNNTPTWIWRREHKTWLIERWKDGLLTLPMEHATAEIKHVHQLQNLYYALTGEELSI